MATTKWVLDPTHSELGFKIRHMMITNVSGNFSGYSVEMQTEGEDLTTARIKVKIDMSTINTNNLQRDEHLRNSDFFEVTSHPEAVFESERVERIDDEQYLLHGNLSLKGVTRPVKLQLEYGGLTKDPWGHQRGGFIITGKVNRTDFGVNFNAALETGGVVLGEEVKVHAEIQLLKEAVSAAA